MDAIPSAERCEGRTFRRLRLLLLLAAASLILPDQAGWSAESGWENDDGSEIRLVKRIVPGDSIGPLPPDDPLEEGGDEPEEIVTVPSFYLERTAWGGSVGLLILQRSSDVSSPLLQNIDDPNALYDYGAIGFNSAPGVDLRINRYFGYGGTFSGWDLRAFWLGDLETQTTIYFDGQWGLPNTSFSGTSASLYASYGSSFYSAEFNLERESPSPALTLLAGFRWLQLNDHIQGSTSFTSGDTLDFRINTANNMYGGQVGMGVLFPGASIPIEISARAKAGVFGNGNSGEILVIDTTSTGSRFSAVNGSEITTAFVGEIDVMVNYRISRNLGIQIGYDVIWLTGAAIAGTQPAVPDPLLSASGYNSSSSALFFGAQMGLTFGW